MQTIVNLKDTQTGNVRGFGFEHAERVLSLRKSGWELVDDNFTFSNGKLNRTDKGKGQKKSEKVSD